MIKITKKRSYNLLFCALLVNSFLLLVLPPYLAFARKTLRFNLLALFYLLNLSACGLLIRKRVQEAYLIKLNLQDLQEKINILIDKNDHDAKSKVALQQKLSRYGSLKSVIEEINEKLSVDSVASILTDVSFSLIAGNNGVCVLYLVDPHTQISLNLFKSRKEDDVLIVKTKEGDIFDFWVRKHAQALLVEDAARDFRFDLNRISPNEARGVSSLISAPLISHHRFLGILRLDSRVKNFYSQDDLRLLTTLCDVGAVALENAELFEKTQDLAIRDGLTSLFTKGHFFDRLKEECERSVRTQERFSLLMLDIDFFKKYNDTFGHAAGDIVLKKISSIMVDALRDKEAIISRFGGEEFCVILLGTDKKDAYRLAEELRERICKEKFSLRRQTTAVTVSIGVAALAQDASGADELVIKADAALYRAKQQGRNRVS